MWEESGWSFGRVTDCLQFCGIWGFHGNDNEICCRLERDTEIFSEDGGRKSFRNSTILLRTSHNIPEASIIFFLGPVFHLRQFQIFRSVHIISQVLRKKSRCVSSRSIKKMANYTFLLLCRLISDVSKWFLIVYIESLQYSVQYWFC